MISHHLKLLGIMISGASHIWLY